MKYGNLGLRNKGDNGLLHYIAVSSKSRYLAHRGLHLSLRACMTVLLPLPRRAQQAPTSAVPAGGINSLPKIPNCLLIVTSRNQSSDSW